MLKVAVEYVKWIMEERAKINRVPLEEIEFYENGMKIGFLPADVESWMLNNVDFITTGEYERSMKRRKHLDNE